MEKPRVADTQPIRVELEAGAKNYWCACGGSRTQPFCDGSHRGTPFTPLEFSAGQDGEAWLCQ